VTIAACIVAPPPELPQPSPRPPQILHASVTPPPDQPLYSWPDGPPNDLIVPVVVNDPAQLEVIVRVDATVRFSQQDVTVVLDGGITTLDIPILLGQSPPIDPNTCHQITVVVAHHFESGAPDENGGDSVSWNYMPSVVSNSCSGFDGAVPSDAAPDHPPIGPPADSGVP
jgi:hypothetical protein